MPSKHILDSEHVFRSNVQIFDQMRIELVHIREALPVLPEELDQPQLREDANNVRGSLLCDQYPVYSAPKDLHGFGQVGRLRERDQRLLLVPDFLHVSQRYRLPFAPLFRELVERGDVFFIGVGEANYEQEVCIQVAVVECPGCA